MIIDIIVRNIASDLRDFHQLTILVMLTIFYVSVSSWYLFLVSGAIVNCNANFPKICFDLINLST